MNLLPSTPEDGAVTPNPTTEPKPRKPSKGTLRFIGEMQHLLAEDNLDYTVDNDGQFISTEVQRLFKVFSKGREVQRQFEPELYLIGKLTEDNEFQISDRPQIMKTLTAANIAIERMSKRFKGTYVYLCMNRSFANLLRLRQGMDKHSVALKEMRIVVRPNSKAK